MSADGGHPVPRNVFPTRSPKILWREVDGSVVLFHEDNGRAFALNETAAAIWKLCDGTRSLEDIISQLGGSYGLDAALTREGAARLADGLAREGCVEMAARPVEEPEAKRTSLPAGRATRRRAQRHGAVTPPHSSGIDMPHPAGLCAGDGVVPQRHLAGCGPAPEAAQGVWCAPVVEEIVFAACDCSGGGRGVIRNAECTTVPRQQVST